MGRRPRVDRTPEEKWQIVQEGIKSGNVSERQRLGGEALPRPKPRKTAASGNSNEHWGGSRWRSKS
jgi:hypothetical protein